MRPTPATAPASPPLTSALRASPGGGAGTTARTVRVRAPPFGTPAPTTPERRRCLRRGDAHELQIAREVHGQIERVGIIWAVVAQLHQQRELLADRDLGRGDHVELSEVTRLYVGSTGTVEADCPALPSREAVPRLPSRPELPAPPPHRTRAALDRAGRGNAHRDGGAAPLSGTVLASSVPVASTTPSRRLSPAPLPRRPLAPFPQQRTAPAGVIAQF